MKTVTVAFILLLASIAFAQSNEVCLGCHDLGSEAGWSDSSQVSPGTLAGSVHSELACDDCHAIDASEDHGNSEAVDCSGCHDEIAEEFEESAHSTVSGNGTVDPPTCSDCHGSHNILASDDFQSATSKANLPLVCSRCHHKNIFSGDPDIRIVDPYEGYMRGIHAEGIARGIGSAAICSDCHGVHDLKRASDPASMVNKQNIPRTCAKCHNDIFIKYSRGIHGKALKAGVLDSPNCSDCHGEHDIFEIDDPSSPVNASNLADYVCGRCHNDPQLVEKYGLEGGRFSSYQDTYHGLAVKAGLTKAANCVSCHEAHDILPHTNPASSVHPNNLVWTCQKCHPNANSTFASSYSHNILPGEFGQVDAVIRILYIILIIVVIGGMLLHNGIIFRYFMILKHRREKKSSCVVRFTGNMVYQHMVLLISFIVLVITGFALRYPDAWWVPLLKFTGITEGTRSVIHRIAAVLMIYISFHHLLFMLMTSRGRQELRAIWFAGKDWQLLKQNLNFYLGRTDKKPHFDRYDYTEKAEYWALAWGTVLMAITGFILWFPTAFMTFLPSWAFKVAETIHLYEAWLAMLAIVFFHLFFTLFHPERYPMSFTWLTGKMTSDEVRHHHPAWHQQLQEEEKNDGETLSGEECIEQKK